jgi:hypothetical protein
MKLSFTGILDDNEVFNDIDAGEPDHDDRQASEPVRLRAGAPPLSTTHRARLIERFFDPKNRQNETTMLREVDVPEEQITELLAFNPRNAWTTYETMLNLQRENEWNEADKRRPHLNLWGYRRRMVSVEGWETAPRDEIVARVKHFVLSNEAEVARLESEVVRFERFEMNPPVSREPISEEVQAFVWRRDGGRCVKCGSQERLEFDHIIPVARGGSNTERNIQLLCEYHNRLKGAGATVFSEPELFLSESEEEESEPEEEL